MVESAKRRYSPSNRRPLTIDVEATKNDTPAAEPIGLSDNHATAGSRGKAGQPKVEQTPDNESTAGQAKRARQITDAQAPQSTEPNQQKGSTMANPSHNEKKPAGNHRFRCLARGFFHFFLGGIGGLIAVMLFLFLQYNRLLPTLPPPSDISSLQSRVSAVEKRLDDVTPATEANEVVALKQKVDELTEAQRDVSSLRTQSDKLEKQITDVAQALQPLQSNWQQLAQQVSAIEETVNQLSAKNDDLQKGLSASRQDKEQLLEVEKNVEALAKAHAEKSADLSRIVATQALKSAVDRGGSYANELQLVEKLYPQQTSLKMLEPYAETGLQNGVELAHSFATIADRIAASQNEIVDRGVIQRLWHKVTGLMTTRPIGNVPGTTPAAIAARIEYALERGDYEKAIAEWQALPQKSKDISSDFIEKLRARTEIDKTLTALISATAPSAPQTSQ